MKRTYRKNKIKSIIIEHVEHNLKIYLILTIIFFIGLVLGIMFINNTTVDIQKGISDSIGSFIDNIHGDYKISKNEILCSAIKNNTISFLFVWLLGCMIIGTPLIYCFIIYKGFALGYTISAVIASVGTGKGILFVIGALLLQNIIYIPVYFAIAVSGINLHKDIMLERKKEEIKINILRHTIFSLMLLIVIFLGALIESYVSGSIIEIMSRYI